MKENKFTYDYYRMTGEKYVGMKRVGLMLAYPHLRFVWWYRSYEKKASFFKRVILLHYAHKYGLEISPTAVIGEGLYLGHPYNITVGGGTVIGNNVNIHKGCTIGRENRGKRTGVPVIGNGVYLGINATVVGNVVIGDDVLIAPNAYVNFDVPSHSVVIGNPGKIHLKDEATVGYVNFKIDGVK